MSWFRRAEPERVWVGESTASFKRIMEEAVYTPKPVEPIQGRAVLLLATTYYPGMPFHQFATLEDLRLFVAEAERLGAPGSAQFYPSDRRLEWPIDEGGRAKDQT